jgi:hypothetical protein
MIGLEKNTTMQRFYNLFSHNNRKSEIVEKRDKQDKGRLELTQIVGGKEDIK